MQIQVWNISGGYRGCSVEDKSLIFYAGPLMPIYIYQSWALALYFQVRSPLISFPWIAIPLALIWPIFRFAHCSIALRKTSGSLSEKSAKTKNRS